MQYLVTDYLETTAARCGEKAAFADIAKTVSYTSLVRGAKGLATAILRSESGIRAVAFYTGKTADTVTGFFGAAYAGCAYSQINLRYPAARVKDILGVISPCAVVTDRAHKADWDALETGREAYILEDLLETPADETLLAAAHARIIDTDPLYINFTSGSTGIPKGVAVCHRSVIDFIRCFTEIFSITESDVIANQAPFDFDVSVKDIYSAVFTGATVQIVPTEYFMQPIQLVDLLCESRTTVLIWAVSALCFLTTMNAFSYRVPETIRAILFSGEVMPVKHLKRLQKYLPGAMYVNLYGPTEITCNCTYYVVDREFANDEQLPIGVPFPNERILLLDEHDRPVTQPGTEAELCVAGTALALGYYNQPDRTAEAFVRNPLNTAWPELIYRTGDLVVIGKDGQIYYKTRKDFQVKHMGHRIELGEIEARLNGVTDIERACCLFDAKKDKVVAAYTGTAEPAGITAQLQETLPSYMLPQIYRRVESFPMNKNGKIDRKALSEELLK